MRRISDLGEFELIARIARAAAREPRAKQVVLGIGDDAAVLRLPAGEDLVVSTDAHVESVHFRFETSSARIVGRRALVANLSDLAAMGARPLGFTAALAAPPDTPLTRFDGLIRGLLAEARTHACPLIGGNLTRASEVGLAITVLGASRRGRALRRDALRPGDRLYVTGTLGGAALAVARAERAGAPVRHVAVPRISAGLALARMGAAHACVDVSDGLAADLGHLLAASGVGAEVDAARLPRPRGFARACAALGLDPLAVCAGGGEDYELLFSLRRAADPAALTRRLGVVVTEIGKVTRTPGLRGLEGASGFSHF